MAAQELRWLTYLLTDLGEPPRSPPVLYVDNKAMLALCREQRLEHRTKHIALRYFLARELQQRGQLRLAYVACEANTADVFTKALAPCDHQRFCTQLGLHIALRYFLARELQQRGQLRLAYVACEANTADVFTKALAPCDHQRFCTQLGLYRSHTARAGRFSQRAQWGLHLGIEKHYNAWNTFDVHSKETVAARDVIFYERLTLQTYLDNLAANRDLTGGFRGNRAFASAADEVDWDEQNVDNAFEEGGPPPYCSVPIPMDEENPRESVNAETYFNFADTSYVTPQPVDTNISERIGPNFLPDPEAGDEAAYPEDTNLPRYTQSGLQILGLVTAVHRAKPPKEPATIQQALGGEHREKWHEAMDKELKTLQERNTWKVVPIEVARNKTILAGKWVFRVKTKVRRHTSLRILLAIAAMNQKKLRQIDVANAFLYAPVDAEIFVELPHGSNTGPNQICQLEKSLYGIKQASRLWQQHLHARLIRIGFLQLPHDQWMYRLTKGTDYILLIVYVDDLLYIGSTDAVTPCTLQR
ncbi:unnamed protein product [Closterium sp. NIES-53]